MTIKTGIFIYNNVEVLDFAGPFEVFSTAARVKSRQTENDAPFFNVFTIGEKKPLIIARGGLKIIPEYDINQHPDIDLLIIPGGVVTEEMAKDRIISWIRNCYEHSTLTASVCTGAFLLAKAGLLDSKKATTHFEDIPDLETMFPAVQVIPNAPFVDQGRIVSSAGISAGIDMSLYIVSRLAGKKLAFDTARQMEYDWKDCHQTS